MTHTFKMFAPIAVENKALPIVEYDENGNPWCYYKGFYRARRQEFKLYPTAGSLPNREERIKTVNDRLVVKVSR